MMTNYVDAMFISPRAAACVLSFLTDRKDWFAAASSCRLFWRASKMDYDEWCRRMFTGGRGCKAWMRAARLVSNPLLHVAVDYLFQNAAGGTLKTNRVRLEAARHNNVLMMQRILETSHHTPWIVDIAGGCFKVAARYGSLDVLRLIMQTARVSGRWVEFVLVWFSEGAITASRYGQLSTLEFLFDGDFKGMGPFSIYTLSRECVREAMRNCHFKCLHFFATNPYFESMLRLDDARSDFNDLLKMILYNRNETLFWRCSDKAPLLFRFSREQFCDPTVLKTAIHCDNLGVVLFCMKMVATATFDCVRSKILEQTSWSGRRGRLWKYFCEAKSSISLIPLIPRLYRLKDGSITSGR
jgi:hypothetical protein